MQNFLTMQVFFLILFYIIKKNLRILLHTGLNFVSIAWVEYVKYILKDNIRSVWRDLLIGEIPFQVKFMS